VLLKSQGDFSPRVSIIIPCWNAEAYVADAISSALAQNYDNKEVIVIDDGSTDQSLAIIKQFSDRIVWCSRANQGCGKTRNHGIQIATGEFIKFLDADDFLLPGCIFSQVKALSALIGNEFPVGRMYRLEDSIGLIVPHGERDHSVRRGESITDLLIDVPVITAPLYRRDVLLNVGGFDETLAIREDFDLFVRVLIAGANPVLTSEPVGVYRNHLSQGRVSRNVGEGKALNQLQMYEKLFELLRALTDSPRQHLLAEGLAISAWVTGRNVLRQGFKEIALGCFALAKRFSPKNHVSGRYPYRIINALFGPLFAELIFEKLKDLSFAK